jgi:hypothetical protein
MTLSGQLSNALESSSSVSTSRPATGPGGFSSSRPSYLPRNRSRLELRPLERRVLVRVPSQEPMQSHVGLGVGGDEAVTELSERQQLVQALNHLAQRFEDRNLFSTASLLSRAGEITCRC